MCVCGLGIHGYSVQYLTIACPFLSPVEWDLNRHGKTEILGPIRPEFYLLWRSLEIFMAMVLYPLISTS